jgi:hypothetical protein
MRTLLPLLSPLTKEISLFLRPRTVATNSLIASLAYPSLGGAWTLTPIKSSSTAVMASVLLPGFALTTMKI